MTAGEPRILVGDGTFAALGPAGDITGARGAATDGLFVRDARHLSRWRLTTGGPLTALRTGPDGAVLAPPATRDQPAPYTVFRDQAVAAGLFAERIAVRNNTAQVAYLTVELAVDADFADQFELRGDQRSYPKPDAGRSVADRPDGIVRLPAGHRLGVLDHRHRRPAAGRDRARRPRPAAALAAGRARPRQP